MGSQKNIKYGQLIVVVLFAVITCIHPIYPREMLLQHSATVMAVLLLIWDIQKGVLGLGGFTAACFFLMLHALGARYIYSYVPYADWVLAISGWQPDHYFGFQRNHYDRLVHFAFGLLAFPVIMDLLKRRPGMSFRLRLLLTWFSIQTFSMVYELFEWQLTIFMSSEAAENYNGQQGDVWDAHKDMALAMLGSLLAAVWYYFFRTPQPVANPVMGTEE